MNTIKTTGDHDPIAEDRPEPESTWREIELGSVVIGETLVEYLCAYNGEFFGDHRWQTRRENPQYPMKTIERWVDPSHFDTALDAIEDADMHKPKLSDGEIELHAANLHAQAALTKIQLQK